MKKFLLTLLAVVAAFNLSAQTTQTYTDSLVVTINGESTKLDSTDVVVTYNDDGTIDFSLKNFILVSEGTEMPVGNINISGMTLTKGESYDTFSFDGGIIIEAGDAEGVDTWLGPYLYAAFGEIPLKLNGEITDDQLHVTIDIDMTSTTLQQSIYVEFGSEINVVKTYTDSLVVTINGESTKLDSTDVVVTYNDDGTIDFSLANLILVSGGIEMPVGNINISGLTLTEGESYDTFSFDDSITIEAGDDETVTWLGPILCQAYGEIPLKLEGKITDSKLYVTIDIDMTSTNLQQSIYVVFGSDFSETSTDGIKAVVTGQPTTDSDAVYDLSGRRVSSSQKGIVIINGKKVIR